MVCVRAHECVCEREREKVREESEENGHGAPVIILSSEIRQVWKIVSMTFSNLEPVGVSCDSFKALVTEYGNETKFWPPSARNPKLTSRKNSA